MRDKIVEEAFEAVDKTLSKYVTEKQMTYQELFHVAMMLEGKIRMLQVQDIITMLANGEKPSKEERKAEYEPYK